MFRILLLLSLCWATCPAATPSKAGRTCRILFLAAPDNAPKSIYLNDGAKTRKVDLPSLNLSDVHDLPPGDITLRLLPSMPADQQPLPAGAPAAAVPEAIHDCYLLVASDPSNTLLPLRCKVVDANPEGFHAGQMLWMNLTPYLVGGQLGSRAFRLKANSQCLVDAPIATPGSYPVKVGYEPGNGKNPVILVSTAWNHNPDGRNVVFVMMLPNSKIPRIKGYSDYRETRKAPSDNTKPETPSASRPTS